ncbi:Miro-like protein [Necator americanus]|uniref:Miro-like protein n=1 Tax=Necator americanus TaxID=51031 RepID=W2TZS0_NECAM|nr:Miro-like protein [Necator americanus]ETN87179.1 Miro-like protein [Necator americanus]
MNFNYSDIMIYPSEAQYAANRFKILVIGRGGSGRSSLLRRFKQNIFHNPKEEISHPEITVVVRAIHGSIVKADLQIMELSSFACNEDVSGPAKVHMAKNFMDVNGVLLVYDTTNVKTFQELCDTLPTLQRMIAPNVDIFLVGTKADLNDQRMVSFDDAEKKIPRAWILVIRNKRGELKFRNVSPEKLRWLTRTKPNHLGEVCSVGFPIS